MARCKLRADLLLENRGRIREIFNEAVATLDADKLDFATKALTFLESAGQDPERNAINFEEFRRMLS